MGLLVRGPPRQPQRRSLCYRRPFGSRLPSPRVPTAFLVIVSRSRPDLYAHITREFFANPRHELIFDRRRVRRRRIKLPAALDRRQRDRRTRFEIDETIRVQGWAVVPMEHRQEGHLSDEGEVLYMERGLSSSSGPELCTCGHARDRHGLTTNPEHRGGPCQIPGCRCRFYVTDRRRPAGQ